MLDWVQLPGEEGEWQKLHEQEVISCW
jgi:hypothetical protein